LDLDQEGIEFSQNAAEEGEGEGNLGLGGDVLQRRVMDQVNKRLRNRLGVACREKGGLVKLYCSKGIVLVRVGGGGEKV